jgi:hypothetical protein
MDDYIDLHIDIFDQPRQHAKVLRSLTIGGLIDEVLKEFDDLDRSKPESYVLFLRGKNIPLDPRMTIGQLDLQMHDELIFAYARSGTGPLVLRAADRAFLQEETTNALFEIKINPALIGRASSDPAHNAALAVNLKFHPLAAHISRRHAQISKSGDQYFVEGLSSNSSTFLNSTLTPITERVPLNTGDRIILSSNQLTLHFFQLPAGSFDESLPLATLRIEVPGATATPVRIFPIVSTPFTIGRAQCDLNLPEDTRLRPQHAEIRYNTATCKYEMAVEGRPAVEVPSGSSFDLSANTRLHFQMV